MCMNLGGIHLLMDPLSIAYRFSFVVMLFYYLVGKVPQISFETESFIASTVRMLWRRAADGAISC